MRILKSLVFCGCVLALSACSGSGYQSSKLNYKGQINDPIMAIALLSEQQHEWAGTPYVLGGRGRKGVDCSGFVQTTFFDRFGIKLPSQTKEQANYGHISKKKIFKPGIWFSLKPGVGQTVIMSAFM